MKKFSKEKKCLIITGGFLTIMFAVFIPVSAVCNLWGLTIGWAIGTAITLLSQFLLFESGKILQRNAKGGEKGTGLVVLFYFSRFGLYLAGLIVCALLQWKMQKTIFNWSVFTCVGALLPADFVITFFYHDDDDNPTPVKKTEENKIEDKKEQ